MSHEILDAPQTDQENFQYAGFLLRFAAMLIDVIILFAVKIFISQLLPLPDVAVLSPFLFITINWLYYSLTESSFERATIGKRAVGIVVMDEQGERISFAKASARYFSKILSGIILFIGYFLAAFTKKKQALHDIIAGTIVVIK